MILMRFHIVMKAQLRRVAAPELHSQGLTKWYHSTPKELSKTTQVSYERLRVTDINNS